jgi:hypothetical protein
MRFLYGKTIIGKGHRFAIDVLTPEGRRLSNECWRVFGGKSEQGQMTVPVMQSGVPPHRNRR